MSRDNNFIIKNNNSFIKPNPQWIYIQKGRYFYHYRVYFETVAFSKIGSFSFLPPLPALPLTLALATSSRLHKSITDFCYFLELFSAVHWTKEIVCFSVQFNSRLRSRFSVQFSVLNRTMKYEVWSSLFKIILLISFFFLSSQFSFSVISFRETLCFEFYKMVSEFIWALDLGHHLFFHCHFVWVLLLWLDSCIMVA